MGSVRRRECLGHLTQSLSPLALDQGPEHWGTEANEAGNSRWICPHGPVSRLSHASQLGRYSVQPGLQIYLPHLKDETRHFLAPTGAQGVTMSVCLSVCDKVLSLHLSGSNLQAVNQQSVSRLQDDFKQNLSRL